MRNVDWIVIAPTVAYVLLEAFALWVIAAHNAAMECYRRAMIGEQTFEGRRENLAQANKLSRTYAALLEALTRSFYWPNLYATPNVTTCDFKETLYATFKEVCVPHIGDGVGEQGRTSAKLLVP